MQPGDFIYQLAGGNHDNVRENDIRYSDVDLHRINNQIIGQGAWIDDALVMIEVLYGDPNDPRYQGSVRNSDWGRMNWWYQNDGHQKQHTGNASCV